MTGDFFFCILCGFKAPKLRSSSERCSSSIRIFPNSAPSLKQCKMLKVGWFDGISQPFKQWFATHITPHLPGGWRTAALVNTILMTIVAILMTMFSSVALVQAGGFNKPVVFYTGSCGISGATTLNTTLHLLINILSTAILASSNMFMQILNAPSREEVDKSHARGSWLDIGVLSARNIFRLSPFKTMAWLGFLASSTPVHLLFNSTVFEASYRLSQYQLAIVAEPFLHGGHYYTPGASLLNSGGIDGDILHNPEVRYGDLIDLVDYQNRSSSSFVGVHLDSISHNTASWTRFDRKTCRQEYYYCSGLSSHTDVVLVVADTYGWPRSQVWNLTERDNSFWNTYVPDDASEPEHNSLWFYGNCTMSSRSENGLKTCFNSCQRALNGSSTTRNWTIPFYTNETTASHVAQQSSSIYNNGMLPSFSAYNFEYNNLSIDYCLARPVQELCKVALSTTLLVSVTGCAILKAILCIWVFYRLRSQQPLTTPGDAINSFIIEPDPHTAGLCLVSQGEVRMRLFCGSPQPGPRQYRLRERRLRAVVPSSQWYLLLLTMTGAVAGATTLTIVVGAVVGGM